MIADLKPYPDYKESGLPWLGQVPGHWEIMRLKRLLRPVDRRSTTGTETLLSLRRDHGVVVYADHFSRPPQGVTTAGFKLVRIGQLVVNRMQANNGLLFHSRLNGLVSPDYSVFEAKLPLHMDYVSDLIRSPYYRAHFRRESTGLGTGSAGFLRLYDDRFLNTTVAIPTLDEQIAMARFFVWANGRLERAIRAKRKVIALLNEQKQAIIHRAVTRGLDPSVPLEPSGIPWLGDIPQHWEVRKLRTLVDRIDQGVSPLAVGFLAEGDSWGVLKSGCVNRGVFRETEHKQLARSFAIDPSIVVNVGDVLVSRACGSPSLVGSVGRVKSLRYQLILSDKTFRVSFRGLVDVDFMVFAMNCRYYRHQVEQAISGAEGMANNLPLSSLRDFCFAIPPANEAVVIAGHLGRETMGLQMAISRLEREIDLLREYRTRLVADVVTGKLDVRDAAARLPDHAAPDTAEGDTDPGDEPEPADEDAVA